VPHHFDFLSVASNSVPMPAVGERNVRARTTGIASDAKLVHERINRSDATPSPVGQDQEAATRR